MIGIRQVPGSSKTATTLHGGLGQPTTEKTQSLVLCLSAADRDQIVKYCLGLHEKIGVSRVTSYYRVFRI
jgi:hypothetical protein